MKLITIIAAFFAATYASAMPTNEAIAKAGAEVQTRIKEQLASWQSGKMSDADMGKLLLIMADGEQDEAMHYVCLQGALAAFARAGDADAATKALDRLRAETKEFTPEIEKGVVEKAVATASADVAAKLRALADEDPVARMDRRVRELENELAQTTSPKRKLELSYRIYFIKMSKCTGHVGSESELFAKLEAETQSVIERIGPAGNLSKIFMQQVSDAKAKEAVIVVRPRVTQDVNSVFASIPLTKDLTESKAVTAADLRIPDGNATFWVIRIAECGKGSENYTIEKTEGEAMVKVVNVDHSGKQLGDEKEVPYQDFHLCAGDVIVLENIAERCEILKIYMSPMKYIFATIAEEGPFDAKAFGLMAAYNEFMSRLDLGTESEKECAKYNVRVGDDVNEKMAGMRETFVSYRNQSEARECVNNREQIQSACEYWRMTTGSDAKPKMSDIVGKGNVLKTEPICPSGGKYIINFDADGNTVVTCSHSDHGNRIIHWNLGGSLMAEQGSRICEAIRDSSAVREAHNRPDAWPRTVAAKGSAEDDISGIGFESAAQYFSHLLDLPNRNSKDWAPFVNMTFDVLGDGAVKDSAILENKLAWCIAANIGADAPDSLPVLVSANFNPALLLRKWDGKTDADKVLPVGPDSGAQNTLFRDEVVVLVRKDGTAQVIDAEELTYRAIYGDKPFDTTGANPPLMYLTPSGVAEPVGASGK